MVCDCELWKQFSLRNCYC